MGFKINIEMFNSYYLEGWWYVIYNGIINE